MMTTVSIDTVGATPSASTSVNAASGCEAASDARVFSGEASSLFQQTLEQQTSENAALGETMRAAMVSVSETLVKVDAAVDDGEAASQRVAADGSAAFSDADGLRVSEDAVADRGINDEPPEASADALVAAGVAPRVAAPAEVASAQTPTAVAAVDAVAATTSTVSADVLIQAASAVADTLLVSPGLLRGQGDVVVQLRPDVLDGTEVKISAMGRQLEVIFQPQTVDMAVMIENCRAQLVQHLSAKIVSFNVSVDVRKKRG